MNEFTYDILKCSSFWLLKVWLNGEIIVKFYYEPGKYLDEFVKSTIIPNELALWINNVQVTEAVPVSEGSCSKKQGSTEAQAGCSGYPHRRNYREIWKPGE